MICGKCKKNIDKEPFSSRQLCEDCEYCPCGNKLVEEEELAAGVCGECK